MCRWRGLGVAIVQFLFCWKYLLLEIPCDNLDVLVNANVEIYGMVKFWDRFCGGIVLSAT